MTTPNVFSVGYQNLKPADLAFLARQLDAVVIDVRTFAWGRVKKGFSRTDLTELLGGRYEWRGDQLGGKGKGTTPAGLAQLQDEAFAGRRMILMCQEEAPGDCHRHHLIACPLLKLGVVVHHIHKEEVIAAPELQRAIDQDDEYEFTDLDEFLMGS